MIMIQAQEISSVISSLVTEANRYLPADLLDTIVRAREEETWATAQFVLDILLENAVVAGQTGLPVCQDTGIDVVFVEMGRDIRISGSLEQAVNTGIADGTAKGLLRPSVCDPLTRRNTGNNIPAVIHVEPAVHDKFRISILPKGCGSENMSSVRMLPPSAGIEGIISAVVEQVMAAGPNPCPPGIIGVGIGGTMEKAALVAKKALMRPVGTKHARRDVSEIEKKIEMRLSDSGIGPMGLGGKSTTLAVHADLFPCHIASLPVAINIQCHAARYAWAAWENGSWHKDCTDRRAGHISYGAAEMPVKPRKVRLPLDHTTVRELRAGEWLLLTGTLFTGRDQTHRRLVELLHNGKPLPVELSGELIYYVGPSPAPEGRPAGSAGPTTSYRMDAYTPDILAQGVLAVMGKGKRSETVRRAMKKYGAVYLATIGGAGAYLSNCIESCSIEAFSDLGPEALYRMEVKDFPAIVINDSAGNDHYGQEKV